MAPKTLNLAFLPFLAAGAGISMLANCSGTVPIGTNTGSDGGEDSPGASSGGSSSSSGAGSSSGSASGSSSGTSSSSSGGGACCPAAWNMYACTYPDGGAGHACHNPALGCASSTTCGVGCDPVVTGVCGGSSSSGAGSSSSGGTGLHWFTTCGPPVTPLDCSADGGLKDDAGAPCPAAGSGCSTQGELCGTSGRYTCPVGLICDTQAQVNCPVSSRKHKEGIEYVTDEGLQQLHDDTLRLQLATYNYKPGISDPTPRHLGFIIEDTPPATPAVGWSRERVDLYGYLSMVVATMQVQEKEIKELRKELASAREGSCR